MIRVQVRNFYTSRCVWRKLPTFESVSSKFTFSKNSETIENLLRHPVNTSVTINGWIDRKPKRVGKNLIFGTLRDSNGDIIQIVDSNSLLASSNVEDVIQIKGELTPKKMRDPSFEQEFEIKLNELKILNSANKKPSQLQDYKALGNYPPEYRYLQLRLPKYQNFLRTRYEASKLIRKNLDTHRFTEVETPMLFKSTPEGAREFLVPTRRSENKQPTFYALPQSPQQYKQLLMASGVHRYFQIARCFRDEDLRSDRQPEFTQVDLEMAFASGNEVMDVVEDTVTKAWSNLSSNGNLFTLNHAGKTVPVSETQSVTKLTYHHVMTNYGIDKPDLRFYDLKILDLSEFKAYGYTNKEFPVFEVIVLRNAFSTKDDYQQNWSKLSHPEEYNHRTPIVVPIENEDLQTTWFEKFSPIATFENPKLITKFLNLKKGDIICGSTRQRAKSLFENPTPLGRLRQLVTQIKRGKELYQSTEKDVAAWIVDFPLFSPVEQEEGEILSDKPQKKSAYPIYKKEQYTATHHPFTMVKLDDYKKLSNEAISCLGQHYDLVVNGVELGGGSTRIHDPELQNYIFKEILKIHQPERLFGHLLTAFEMGTPPHAGFAIGFDRMCAMMCGTESIRDVIAFPKSVTGSDLVVGSPSTVDEQTLEEYNIKSVQN